MVEIKCLNCGKPLTKKQTKKAEYSKREPKFCSRACVLSNQKGSGNPNYKNSIKKRKCIICGRNLTREQLWRKNKFCSNECHGKWMSENLNGKNNYFWKENKNRKCLECGNKLKTHQKKFCSTDCMYKNKDRRKKLRIARIKEIKDKNGHIFPNYNKKACEFFKEFDKHKNTNGFFGEKEFLIEHLGYFLDYINFDLKLIIEWDEERHYKNNKLKIKDKIRQKEIEEFYPNFNFIRIREKFYKLGR